MADSPIETALSPGTTQSPNSSQETIVDEGKIRYHKGGFHPVHPSEIYNTKYKVLRKLGYGRYSTVWLVRNQE